MPAAIWASADPLAGITERDAAAELWRGANARSGLTSEDSESADFTRVRDSVRGPRTQTLCLKEPAEELASP